MARLSSLFQQGHQRGGPGRVRLRLHAARSTGAVTDNIQRSSCPLGDATQYCNRHDAKAGRHPAVRPVGLAAEVESIPLRRTPSFHCGAVSQR